MTTVELVAPVVQAVLDVRKNRKARFATITLDRALEQLAWIVRNSKEVPNDRFSLRMRFVTVEAILTVCGDCAKDAVRAASEARNSL
ncbi:MAG: hypothetical protein AMXMBFR16_13160 [Candidatus Uhrbacteria bacterium]